MDLIQLQEKFVSFYGEVNFMKTFFAPARINLIGEHIDYNGGYVFPAAISLGTYAVASLRDDQEVHFTSLNMEDEQPIVVELDDLSYDKNKGWVNYPMGMLYMLHKESTKLNKGLNILYYGEIPNGAGLSSSASIELVTGIMANELFNLNKSMKELVLLGKQVENDYIGVNSGIMDQFAIGFGKKNHAILLDCQSLDYQYAPLYLDDYKIVIIHTNKRRSLAESKYNERKKQCETALSNLQEKLEVNYLCELNPQKFEEYKYLIKDEVIKKRAQHVIYEHERTKEAYSSLQEDDLLHFGKLMYASHQSLRDLYEVSGKELDTIVEAAYKQEGVVGARMTGAGFGGCAIAIVRNDQIEQFKENVEQEYKEEIGYLPSFYEAKISDGPHKL